MGRGPQTSYLEQRPRQKSYFNAAFKRPVDCSDVRRPMNNTDAPALRGNVKNRLQRFTLREKKENVADYTCAHEQSPKPLNGISTPVSTKEATIDSVNISGHGRSPHGSDTKQNSSPELISWKTTPQRSWSNRSATRPGPQHWAKSKVATPSLKDPVNEMWDMIGSRENIAEYNFASPTPALTLSASKPSCYDDTSIANHTTRERHLHEGRRASKRRRVISADSTLHRTERVSSLIDSLESSSESLQSEAGQASPCAKTEPQNPEDDFEDFDFNLNDIEEIEASWNAQNGSGSLGRTQLVVKSEQKSPSAMKSSSKLTDSMLEGLDDADFTLLDDDLSSQSTPTLKRSSVIRENIYRVVRVSHSSESLLGLVVANRISSRQLTLKLQGQWAESSIEERTTLYIEDARQEGDVLIVDDRDGHIIVHPEILISATKVGDSFSCIRKAVLQEHLKDLYNTSRVLILGNIMHELFQRCLRDLDYSDEHMAQIMHESVRSKLQDLYSLDENFDIADITSEVRQQFSALRDWSEKYISQRPKPEATVNAKLEANGRQAVAFSIVKLLDVEEHIWSPRFGLKGNIDATVQVCLLYNDGVTRQLAMPFELKTGKLSSNISHNAQVMLYTLMMKDRYEANVSSGLLYYSQTGETTLVQPSRPEIVSLLIARNKIALHIKSKKLPNVLRNQYTCKKCYAIDGCLTYAKAIDGATEQSTALGQVFSQKVGHLKPSHGDFLRHWEGLLDEEEKFCRQHEGEMWELSSEERATRGRCIPGLTLISLTPCESPTPTRKLTARFGKIKSDDMDSGSAFVDLDMVKGDSVIISDEQGHWALARGSITHIDADSVIAEIDHELHSPWEHEIGFDSDKNQLFKGVGHGLNKSCDLESTSNFRIDRDDIRSGFALIRRNLVCLLSEKFQSALRSQIIELKTPQFRMIQDLPGEAFLHLNEDQKAAISKVHAAEDYTLILGMPGSGKTTTIASLVKSLVDDGKTVLLASYTHSAVDNILLKLRASSINIVRIGHQSKVHPALRRFCIQEQLHKANTVSEIRYLFNEAQVVATTCLGMTHTIFNHKTFDFAVIDEASQITLPTCIGPLLKARKFVLVGDHFQLPPLVKSKQAIKHGMDKSLFRILCEAFPGAVHSLRYQYRMNEDIMALSNLLIYNGSLRCATDAQRNVKLEVPQAEQTMKQHRPDCGNPGRCWLGQLLEEENRVLFFNTDEMEALETRKGEAITNVTECSLVEHAVNFFVAAGICEDDIGVICPYRAQLRLLSSRLANHGSVEINTVDRYQGRDKDLIVISMVRSNKDGILGELISDPRRLNVTFTRARKKLVVFGSYHTLKADFECNKVFDLLHHRGWVHNLPTDALLAHESKTGRHTRIKNQENAMTKEKRAFIGASRLPDINRKSGVLKDIVNSG